MPLITDPAALSPYFSVAGDNVTVAASGYVQITRGNPQRILLSVSTTSAGNFGFGPGNVKPDNGPRLIRVFGGGAGSFLLIVYRDWGPIVGWSWYAAGMAGTVFAVCEVLFNPPKEWSREQVVAAINSLSEMENARLLGEVAQGQ